MIGIDLAAPISHLIKFVIELCQFIASLDFKKVVRNVLGTMQVVKKSSLAPSNFARSFTLLINRKKNNNTRTPPHMEHSENVVIDMTSVLNTTTESSQSNQTYEEFPQNVLPPFNLCECGA